VEPPVSQLVDVASHKHKIEAVAMLARAKRRREGVMGREYARHLDAAKTSATNERRCRALPSASKMTLRSGRCCNGSGRLGSVLMKRECDTQEHKADEL
jgi:hypothetical protein